MRVAIVILNYNSSSDCAKCISYIKQQQNCDYEIIVVDNCSKMEDVEQLRILCAEEDCTLLENKENKGYNTGNNVGLRYAAEKAYEYALIINPDMELIQTDYLALMTNKMQENIQIVVVASDIVTTEGVHQNPMLPDGNWLHQFGWIKGIFKRGKKNADSYDFIDNYKESHYCHKVSGCCFLIRMSFLKAINFFDEYPFLYCEEAILGQQVQAAKHKMYYMANIQAIHRHISSEKGDPIARFKHWKRSRVYFFEQYSNDSWLGKKISILSFSMYIGIFSFLLRRRNYKQKK